MDYHSMVWRGWKPGEAETERGTENGERRTKADSQGVVLARQRIANGGKSRDGRDIGDAILVQFIELVQGHRVVRVGAIGFAMNLRSTSIVVEHDPVVIDRE